jgi:hypothetical protein
MEINFVSAPENEGHFCGHNRSFAIMFNKLITHQRVPHCRLEAHRTEKLSSVSYSHC